MQCRDHRLRVEIDVGRNELARLLQRHVGLVDLELGEIDALAHVISRDHTDLDRPEPESLGEPRDHPCGAFWIGRAEVAQDLDAVPHAFLEHGFEQPLQHRLVAAGRVASFLQLRERHGALAEAFEEEGSRAAARNERVDNGPRRVDAVPGEPGTVANAENVIFAQAGAGAL